MRTVTLMGLTAIADAINPDWCSKETVVIFGIVFVCAILGDIRDFFAEK